MFSIAIHYKNLSRIMSRKYAYRFLIEPLVKPYSLKNVIIMVKHTKNFVKNCEK